MLLLRIELYLLLYMKTAAESPNAFHWAGQLPDIAPFRWACCPHLTQGSLCPHESPPNFILTGSAVFAQYIRQADRAA